MPYTDRAFLWLQEQCEIFEAKPTAPVNSVGKNNPFFTEAGAKAYLRDVKKVDYHSYDTGHFALEEEGDAIINNIRNFMQQLG